MNFKLIILWLVAIILFVSCEKEIHITNPKIFVTPMTPHMLDTLVNEIFADVEIDGVKVNADKYEWEIRDSKNEIVPIIKHEGAKIKWLPRDKGIHTISCNIISGKKSLKTYERYDIDFYSPVVYKYLIGKWNGYATIGNTKKWYMSLNVNANNSVNTKIDSVCYGQVTSSIGFNMQDPSIWNPFYIYEYISTNIFTGTFNIATVSFYIKNITFTETMNEFSMNGFYIDYTVDTKEKPKIYIDYKFTKVK